MDRRRFLSLMPVAAAFAGGGSPPALAADARRARQIDIVAEANSLPRRPAVSEVFSRAFLPPLGARPTRLFG